MVAVVQIILIWLYLAAPFARVLVPGIKDPDMVLPSLIFKVVPTALAAFFMVGVLAIIMSIVDSILLVISSAVVVDFIRKSRVNISEKSGLKIARIASVLIGILALIITISPPAEITFLMAWSFGLFAATFTPILVGGFYWKRLTREGAVAALIGGAASVLIWGGLKQPWGFQATTFGIIIATVLAIVVSKLTAKPPEKVIKTFFTKEK